jgi:tetratricopeptide (TPR) repeat protein
MMPNKITFRVLLLFIAIFVFCYSYQAIAEAAGKIDFGQDKKPEIVPPAEPPKPVETFQANIEKSLSNALSENMRLSTENTELKKKLKDLEDYARGISILAQTAKNDNDSLTKQVEASKVLDQKVKDLSLEIETLLKQNSDINIKVSEYNAYLKDLRSENKKLRSKLDENILIKENASYKIRLDKAVGEKTKALLGLSKAVKEKISARKECAILHYNLGCMLFKSMDYKKAKEEFELAIKFNPINQEAYYNLGIIYEDYLGDDKKAITYYRKNLELTSKPSGSNNKIVNDTKKRLINAQLREKARISSPIDATMR